MFVISWLKLCSCAPLFLSTGCYFGLERPLHLISLTNPNTFMKTWVTWHCPVWPPLTCSSNGELWAPLALFSDFSGTSYMALALVTLQMQRSGMPKSTEHCNLPGMSYSNDKALTDEPLGTKNLELRFLLCYFEPLPFQLYNRVDGLPWWILAL